MFRTVVYLTLVALLLTGSSAGRKREQPSGAFSIDVDAPHEQVLGVVREVANNGVILGTFEYKDAEELSGAEFANPCPFFKSWAEAGDVFCKVRKKTLSPAHFIGSNDLGTVAVRYVVQALTATSTRLLIDAVFVEDARHNDHPSDGSVEASEFGLIQQHLRPTATGIVSAGHNADTSSESKASADAVEQPNDSGDAADSMHVAAAVAELRAAPNSSSKMLRSLNRNEEVAVLRRGQYWYQVRCADGQIGWLHRSAFESRLVAVPPAGADIRSEAGAGGKVLFRAKREDEFEVVSEDGDWVQVRLDGKATGWIARHDLNLPQPPVSKAAASAIPGASELGFWVSREQVDDFAGEWQQLQNKKVLFVFAQSRGTLPDMAGDDRKLAFTKQIFVERYHASSLAPKPFEGIVVIFVGGKGGVAAASLKDIKEWVAGSLSEDAFLSRCSLDPASEFLSQR